MVVLVVVMDQAWGVVVGRFAPNQMNGVCSMYPWPLGTNSGAVVCFQFFCFIQMQLLITDLSSSLHFSEEYFKIKIIIIKTNQPYT